MAAAGRRVVVVVVAVASRVAVATAAAPHVAVETDTREVRACLPMPGGGVLWGTGGGLVRADATGAVVAAWTASDGLPGTRIEAVVEAGNELWIATDGGAARIAAADADAGALTIERAVSGRPVRAIARLAGRTYLATWNGGLRVVGRKAPIGFARGAVTGARARVSSLAVQDGALYAGTEAGLYQLAADRLVAVELGAAADQPITALLADGDRLWIATPGGLFARDSSGAVVALGGGDLRALAADGDEILAAGVADGVVRVDRGRLVGVRGAPRALAVAQALGVRGDALCAGGLAGGWSRATAAADWVPVVATAGPPANDIAALAVDGDRLWVGTFDHGLAVRDPSGWRTFEAPELDGRINAILVEPRATGAARVWVATANGLSTIDGDRVTRLARRDGLPGRGVLALARLRDGRILIGTSYGAVIVGDGRPVRLGPKTGELGTVWAVAEDADGALWLGTTTGLYRGKDGDDAWQRYALASGALRDDWVTALVAKDRAVYAGTYKGGVTRFDLGGAAAAADAPVTATQLGDGWINPGGLAFDGVRLLAATMDGLLVGDGQAATWTATPGLPGRDTTAAVRLGDALYVSTRRGLAVIR